MSLLRRIEHSGNPGNLLRRLLLQKLHADGDLLPRLQAIIKTETIRLSDDDHQRMESEPVDFLLGVRRPSARHEQLSTRLPDEIKQFRQAVINLIASDEEMVALPIEDYAAQRARAEVIFSDELQKLNLLFSRVERSRLFESILADLIGFGPLEPLLADETVTELRVIGAKHIMIVRQGRRERIESEFEDERHLLRVIDRIFGLMGIRIDESNPFATARMPDGSHVSVIIRPSSLVGPTLTIVKSSPIRFQVDDLARLGSITPEAVTVLQACVQAGLNILVAGDESAGKSALLNVLGGFIPNDEFIVTVERSPELLLTQDEVVPLQSRPPNIELKGEITLAQLIEHTARMRPDWIIVGELDGEEGSTLLRTSPAWLATIRSRDPEDALVKLESLYLMGDSQRPIQAARAKIAAAVDLIVQIDRLHDGTRKITRISNVGPLDSASILLNDLFAFDYATREHAPRLGWLRLVGKPDASLLRRITEFPVDAALADKVRAIFKD
jgi:pilus assembly protein CpaF